MGEVEDRLHDTSKRCFDCYEIWSKDQKNQQARADLQEAIHELRKVASRLEIEMAHSERDNMAKNPIPIPPHRDSRRKTHDDDNVGNQAGSGGGGSSKPKVQRRPARGGGGRSAAAKKSSEE